MTAPKTDAMTDTQSVIAALRQQLEEQRAEREAAMAREAALAEALAARTAELSTRDSEYGERIEHQAATIDVLKAMSASPGDPQPVFDLIARQAANQCNVPTAAVATFDGKMMHLATQSGFDAAYAAQFPRPVGVDFSMGRAVLNQRVDQVEDITADPGHSFAPVLGPWSVIAVPILRDGQPLGAITIGRPAMGPFSASQVALLQTFAEQAVIAITSAETYRALQTRTSDLQETLEYQTAISDMLKIISRATFDLQPLLDAVVQAAARLCDAEQAVIIRREGELMRLVANHGFPPEYEALAREHGTFPIDSAPRNVGPRAIREGRVIHVHDVAAEPGYTETAIRLGKQRTSLGVPLLREGEAIGTILLARQRVEPFTDRQIELVSTFADQAVIAIENTRLLTEQREALEQQTATAEVLQVINSSPGNLAPVFKAILDKAHTLCGATLGSLFLFDGELFCAAATHGYPEDLAQRLRQGTIPAAKAQLLDESVPWVHNPDLTLVDGPTARAVSGRGGVRTNLMVPLRKDGKLLGAISCNRREVRPFTDKEIALLQNFAAQAVIAMENARLITEQREALEQQTATAEVLQVINASPGDLAPVFDAMLERALRLCGAAFGALHTYDGERFQVVALRGIPSAFAAIRRDRQLPTDPDSRPGQMLVTGRPVQLVDAMTDPYFVAHPNLRDEQIDLGGVRSALNIPLLKDGTVVGAFVIYRKEPGVWPDKQVALLESFAAQAVIAMENARLLTEQQEALEQQTATAEVLQVINASPGNLASVFDAMLEKAMRLCGGTMGGIFTFDGDHSVTSAVRGVTAAFQEYNDKYPMDKIQPGTVPARVIETGGPVQNPDLTVGERYRAGHPYARALVELGGIRAVLAVPLLKDGVAIGMVAIYRQEPGAFTDKEIALLQNFAAQAVIAMENARLITEQREALEQQTATAEVLGVINSNPGDLAPVFDAMLEKAHGLCGIAMGSLELYDGQCFRAVAVRGLSDAFADMLRQGYPASENPATGPLIDGGRLTHIRDLAETDYAITRSGAELDAARTLLCVPLRREGTLLGMIASSRKEVRPFSDKEIALLENFAAQAVIAMENARLLTEQREALEQQTATAEVLQVINASPGNLQPVFEAILEKAHNLCDVAVGSLSIYLNGVVHTAATRGFSEEYQALLRRPYPAIGSHQALMRGGPSIQTPDFRSVPVSPVMASSLDHLERMKLRTGLWVPLRKDGTALGCISSYRDKVQPFSEKEVALLENFAAQAVIAMENARLLDEIRQRQAELRVTFDNMGDGVVMFDAEHRLAAWNRNFQELLDIPDAALAKRPNYADYLRLLAERGEFGAGDIEAELARRLGDTDRELRLERTRPDGRVIELRRNPVPDGGFVLIYSDISERKRSEAEIRAARDAAEAAYRDLKAAQANLIQAEKMASLGQLTAGIAHEIKNPLNFVNNFAALSVDLLSELKETAAPGFAVLTEKQRAEVEEVSVMLTSNLEKITEHGKRADGIVKAMLEHSRGSSGERRMVDLNALIDEALNLAYHGARAQDQSFNITLERDYGAGIAPVEVNPQDITRVFLNLFANGFYAVTKRAREGGDAGFEPTLKVSTRDAGEAVEIRVRDNGTGIPTDIRDKLFQPFFTTKPTGEGTGLGLSITYDIVTQQHGGSISVDSKVGNYSEFTIRLPRNP